MADRNEAEDITSETFERAVRYRDRYEERRGDPIAWLLGIARNCIYDAQLKRRPDPSPEPEQARPGIDAEVVARVSLEQALGTLSPDDRELLALRYGADLPVRAIATLLDRRTNTVEVALSRARTRLAAAIDEVEDETGTGIGGQAAGVSNPGR